MDRRFSEWIGYEWTEWIGDFGSVWESQGMGGYEWTEWMGELGNGWDMNGLSGLESQGMGGRFSEWI